MGLILSVYRPARFSDCTNGGLTGGDRESVTVVNVEGPFEPTDDRPAVLLVDGPAAGTRWNPIIVPAVKVGDEWVPERREGIIGPMAGGNFAGTSDSRWNRRVDGRGVVSVHDRFETPAEYAILSR